MNEILNVTSVLFANEAFYHAFSQRDFATMERLWARERPVLCIHPGWPALTEHAAILESWRRILQNPASGPITPHHARAFMYDVFAAVVCYEQIQGALLVANNLFLVEGGEIRIFQHHSSHCANPPAPETRAAPALQ
jgi:hypothetical protein